jgi:hypothetical protein
LISFHDKNVYFFYLYFPRLQLAMREPMLCPAGYVCDIEGMAFTDHPCPAGHYCEPGVATLDPASRVFTKNRPQVCPEGYYCLEGVSDPFPQEGNFSTPQKCAGGFNCRRGSDNLRGSGPCITGHYCPPGSGEFLALLGMLAPTQVCELHRSHLFLLKTILAKIYSLTGLYDIENTWQFAVEWLILLN